jgi:hypothetical protein
MKLQCDLEAGVPRSLFGFDAAIGNGVDSELQSMFDSGARSSVISLNDRGHSANLGLL